MQKIIIALLVGLGIGGAAIYYKFPRTITLPAEVRTEIVTKTVTVTKERIVQPDGTVIVREVAIENSSSNTATKTIERALPGWSLGAAYRPDIARLLEHQWSAWEVTAGRRLVGDTWLDITANPIRKEISLGFSYKF